MAIVERRKSIKDLASFTVRVTPQVKAKLEEIAYEDKKSFGRLVEEILCEFLNDK